MSWQQTSHNPEVAGSNPAPVTRKALETGPFAQVWFYCDRYEAEAFSAVFRYD
jgi:hypothetical protein